MDILSFGWHHKLVYSYIRGTQRDEGLYEADGVLLVPVAVQSVEDENDLVPEESFNVVGRLSAVTPLCYDEVVVFPRDSLVQVTLAPVPCGVAFLFMNPVIPLSLSSVLVWNLTFLGFIRAIKYPNLTRIALS
jgi:hypothetical protein